MPWLVAVDWHQTFGIDTPVVEIVVRGTVMYIGLFLLLRLVLRREQGAMGVSDLLVIVLIADAAQNGMAGDYKSVPDGLILVATIVFWALALDWLGYHVGWFERLMKPPAVDVVRDGRLLRKNMRRELLTEDELRSQLRLAGVKDLADVARASVEPDGRVSVIERTQGDEPSRAPERRES